MDNLVINLPTNFTKRFNMLVIIDKIYQWIGQFTDIFCLLIN